MSLANVTEQTKKLENRTIIALRGKKIRATIRARLYTRAGHMMFVGPRHVVRAWNRSKARLGLYWGWARVGPELGQTNIMIAIVMMDYMIKYPTYEHQVLQVKLTEIGQLGLNNIPIETKTSIKL
jgi:hypothetical protein